MTGWRFHRLTIREETCVRFLNSHTSLVSIGLVIIMISSWSISRELSSNNFVLTILPKAGILLSQSSSHSLRLASPSRLPQVHSLTAFSMQAFLFFPSMLDQQSNTVCAKLLVASKTTSSMLGLWLTLYASMDTAGAL